MQIADFVILGFCDCVCGAGFSQRTGGGAVGMIADFWIL